MRVDLFLAPYEDKDGRIVLDNDTRYSLEQMVADMEDLSQYLTEEEIAELQDEIAETYRFHLCSVCRKKFHKKLKKFFLERYWR